LTTVCLTKSKEGDRADKDGAGVDAGLLGLEELNDRLGLGSELESLVVLEGGLDVVVVGVEPLDHFLRFVSFNVALALWDGLPS
jgi:hypothetical protein